MNYCVCFTVSTVFLLPEACSASWSIDLFSSTVPAVLHYTAVWEMPLPLPWRRLYQPVLPGRLVAAYLWPSHMAQQGVWLPCFPSLPQVSQYNNAPARLQVCDLYTVHAWILFYLPEDKTRVRQGQRPIPLPDLLRTHSNTAEISNLTSSTHKTSRGCILIYML